MSGWISNIGEVTKCKSRKDFYNPFYVIVHSDEALKNRIFHGKRFGGVLEEIEFIKQFEDFHELGSFEDPEQVNYEIPINRPVLVCGFFRDCGVKIQRDALRERGYDAHACLEGSFSFE